MTLQEIQKNIANGQSPSLQEVCDWITPVSTIPGVDTDEYLEYLDHACLTFRNVFANLHLVENPSHDRMVAIFEALCRLDHETFLVRHRFSDIQRVRAGKCLEKVQFSLDTYFQKIGMQ